MDNLLILLIGLTAFIGLLVGADILATIFKWD